MYIYIYIPGSSKVTLFGPRSDLFGAKNVTSKFGESKGHKVTLKKLIWIITYIYHEFMENLGKYTIHGSYGIYIYMDHI